MSVKAMDCKKCGKELTPDSKFCLYCGEPVVEEKPPKFNENKKKGKARYWLIGAAAMLFTAGLLIAVFFADIAIWFERNVLPPEALMAKAFASVAQDAGLGEIGDSFYPGVPYRYTAGIYVDEDILDLLSAAEGDSAWITDLNLQLLTGKADELTRTKMSLRLKEESIVSMDVIQNAEKAWLGVPELNERYLEIGKENLNTQQINELKDKIPSDKEFMQMLRTYGSILFDSIHDVTKKNADINLEGIHQNVLQLTATVRPEDYRKALSRMAQELKEDETAEELLVALAGENALAEAVSKLEDLAQTGGQELQLITYLDDRNKLIGLELKNGNTLFYWAQAEKSGRYASRLACGELVLTGSGTCSGEKKTGEHTLSVKGKKILTYKLKNFAVNKKGFSGALIFPIDGASLGGGVPGLAEFSLELSQETVAETEVLSFRFVVGERALLGLTFTAEKAKDFSADPPDAVVSIEEADTVEAWAEDLDWSSILQRLMDAGVPIGAMGSMEE